MKKLIYIVFLLFSTGLMAQNSKVVSAYNAKKDGDFGKAVEMINEAAEHPKTMDEAKTWLYRGQIYQQIAASEEDFGVDRTTAVAEAMESFKKALKLDEKERWSDQTKLGLSQMRAIAVNNGIAAYNAKNYEDAQKLFLIGEEAAAKQGFVDTLAIYNGGLAAEQAGNYEAAIEQYQKAAEVDYMGAKIYLYMANLYNKQDKPEKYIEVIKEGRKAYPEDADLIVYELNYYLKNNKYEEAENNLKLAIEKEPDNKQLHFSLGVVYDNLKEYEKAISSYKKAIELDPDYFDPTFNLGALYFNKGVEMRNEANDIEDNAKYNAALEEAKKEFKKALPYLEKAHKMDPDDISAIASLTQLYAQLGMNDKYTEMKAKQEAASEK